MRLIQTRRVLRRMDLQLPALLLKEVQDLVRVLRSSLMLCAAANQLLPRQLHSSPPDPLFYSNQLGNNDLSMTKSLSTFEKCPDMSVCKGS